MKKLISVLAGIILGTSVFSQSMWTATSFPLTKDTISLQDMTGATTAVFGGNYTATPLLDFPSGFTFRVGFTSYTQFSISAYGYIKLGGIPFLVNPTLQNLSICIYR